MYLHGRNPVRPGIPGRADTIKRPMKFIPTLMLSLLVAAASCQEHFRVAFLVPDPAFTEASPGQADSILQRNAAHLDSLHTIGELVLSGQVEGGGNLLFFPDFAEEHVLDLLRLNPALNTGLCRLEQYAITVPVGTICPVPAHGDSTVFSLIRYESTPAFRLDPEMVLIGDHTIFAESPPPIADVQLMGWFNELPGCGIMVLRNRMTLELSAWIDSDPLLTDNAISYTYSEVVLDRRSFCRD